LAIFNERNKERSKIANILPSKNVNRSQFVLLMKTKNVLQTSNGNALKSVENVPDWQQI